MPRAYLSIRNLLAVFVIAALSAGSGRAAELSFSEGEAGVESPVAAVPGVGAAGSPEALRTQSAAAFDGAEPLAAVDVAARLRAAVDAAQQPQPTLTSAPGGLGEGGGPAHPGWTPLQRHAAFFDRNGDGIVTLAETVESLKLLGIGGLKARAIALAIHVGLGPKTSGRWDCLDIHIDNIKAGKHASDTGVFDATGAFVPAAFESLFDRFDVNHSGSLSETEIAKLIAADAAQRPGGAAVARAEFTLLLDVAADRTELEDGKPVRAISKERLKSFYDGTLLYDLARQRQAAG